MKAEILLQSESMSTGKNKRAGNKNKTDTNSQWIFYEKDHGFEFGGTISWIWEKLEG